jgi:NADH-quinone oxidoreductase subunit J
MLDIDFAALKSGFARYLPFGVLLALIVLAEMIFAVGAWEAGAIAGDASVAPTPEGVSNISALGTVLYTRYLFVFEGAGLVLLVAMIGAIVLTSRTRAGTRPQNVAAQNRRRPKDAVRLVDQPVGEGVEL